MNVTLRYFDGCPNWQTTDSRVRQVLDGTGRVDVVVSYEKVETAECQARSLHVLHAVECFAQSSGRSAQPLPAAELLVHPAVIDRRNP